MDASSKNDGLKGERPAKTEEKIFRLSVNLNKDAAATLREIAARKGLSITEVIRRAIAVYDFVEDAQERGRRIQIVDGNERTELRLIG